MFTFQIKVLKSQDPFFGVSFVFFFYCFRHFCRRAYFNIGKKNQILKKGKRKRVLMCTQVTIDPLITITQVCIFRLLRDNSLKVSFYLFIAIMTTV